MVMINPKHVRPGRSTKDAQLNRMANKIAILEDAVHSLGARLADLETKPKAKAKKKPARVIVSHEHA
jgi:hypothetical protein